MRVVGGDGGAGLPANVHRALQPPDKGVIIIIIVIIINDNSNICLLLVIKLNEWLVLWPKKRWQKG
jgi:hypothetical protein